MPFAESVRTHLEEEERRLGASLLREDLEVLVDDGDGEQDHEVFHCGLLAHMSNC